MTGPDERTEWLSLIDVSGPFLAPAVLEEVFPQGLEKIETPRRRRIRAAYEEWQDAVDDGDPQLADLHAAWTRIVLEEALEYEAAILIPRGDGTAGLSYSAPEHGASVEPDYAVRSDDGALRLLVAVHTPGTDLDRPSPDDRWPASPGEKMTLLCRANGVRLGLVTDGEQWMLVNAPIGGTSGYATWFARLWWQEPVTFKAFVSLLGVRRCFGPPESRLDQMLERSLGFQEEVTDTLGEQVRRAVEVLVQALGRADQDRDGELLKDVSPAALFEAGLTIMMRLVFVLCAEERRLLLLGDPTYDQHYAISTLRARLREDADRLGLEVLERRHDAWSRMLATFRAVYGGIDHEAIRLPALGGSLFDPDRFPFLEGRPSGTSWRETPANPLPIDNRTSLLLLEALQILEQARGARLLSYRALDVEQIGHVYEGLLEYTVAKVGEVSLGLIGSKKASHPIIALRELEALQARGAAGAAAELAEITGRNATTLKNAFARAADESALPRLVHACGGDEKLARRVLPFAEFVRPDSWGTPVIYRKGTFAVTPGPTRRETGTHYTPKVLTETIVEKTLGPVVYAGPAEGEPPEKWRLRSPSELLDLKICDPAMGSGAFLVQTCRYLAERLVESWGREEEAGRIVTVDGIVVDPSESTERLPPGTDERLVIARRLVAERCLYGVDLNPLAVELAKLSIWLVTLAKGRPFGFLDHNLRCGDSLLGIHRLDQLIALDMQPSRRGRQGRLFGKSIEKAVGAAVALRTRLRQRPIRDIKDVEAMASLDQETRRILEGPELLADALIADVLQLGASTARLDTATNALAIEADKVLEGDESAILELRTRVRSALEEGLPSEAQPTIRRLFQWPLQFPEVFSGSTNQGFDVLLGNPPYVSYYGRDSMASKKGKSGFDLFAGAHLGTVDGLAAVSGRINTFLLFMVRSVQQSRAMCGLVLPDTVVTNESYEDMRVALTATGRAREIIRYEGAMFRGATVGTAIVVLGPPREPGQMRLTAVSDSGLDTSHVESATSVRARPSCSWLPISTSSMKRSGLPESETVAISEIAHVKDGINPGSKSTRERLLSDRLDGDPSLRPCMEGKWIEPFVITIKDLWVRYDPSRLTAAERKAGASLREEWIFNSPKIVYRQTAPHIIAAVDPKGLCARNSVHSVVLKKHDDNILYALVAYLNSAFFREYYQSMTGETRKVFPQVHVSAVKKLRVPRSLLDPGDEKTRELAGLAKKLSMVRDDLASGLKPQSDSEIRARIDSVIVEVATGLWERDGSTGAHEAS
jgi:hypothetical protein